MKIILTSLLVAISLVTAAQNYKLEGNEVKIDKPVLFVNSTDKLKPESDDALNIIKKYLEDKSYISLLRVEGHSDNTGDEATNQQLTEKRALAICLRLVQLGVDCKRLLAVGFGSTKPVAENNTPEGKTQNQRCIFVNVSLRGHIIGGLPVDGGGKPAGEVCNGN